MNNGSVRFRPLKSLFLMLSLLILSGCDNAGTPTASNDSAAQVVVAEQTAQAKRNYTAAEREELAKRFKDRTIELVDVSELQLDGASTLVATFSIPLDPEQNFNNSVYLVDSVSGRVDGSWEVSPNLTELRMRHLEPSRKLTFTIESTVKAINGERLGNSRSVEIETSAIYPSVGFSSRGSLLPAKIAEGLPVIALNVKAVDVNFFRIKPEFLSGFVADWENRSSLRYWESSDFLKMTELVYGARFDLDPRRNTRENLLLPLQSIKPLQEEPGVYLAVMQEAGTYYNYTIPATLFTLSDIGLSVRSSANSLDVFTLTLENGEPLKGVNVQLLDTKGAVLGEAKTDRQGHARLSKDVKGASLIMATFNGQTSMISLTKPALDLSEFSIAGPQSYNSQFFAFGPRDIYRPGETVVVNGLLRNIDGKPLPAQPIKVDILKPDNQVARSFVWQPENELYQYQYAVADNAPTGDWKMRFDLGDGKPRYYSFKVEDFLPERMALEISVDPEPLGIREDVSFKMTGRYLYGAPAAGNRLQGQLLLRPLRDAVAKLPGFEFGSITDTGYSRRLGEFDITVDSKGVGFVEVDNEWSSSKSPLNVIIQASLLESGGRPVTRTAYQAIWPAETLPGIRPLFKKSEIYDYRSNGYKSQYVVDEDSQAEFDIVYSNFNGDKLAASDLDVRLIRERRDYYWNWSDSEGWQSGYNQKDLVMDSLSLDISKGDVAKLSFPVEWGSYRLEVKDKQTNAISSIRFWAGYSWQESTGNGGGVRPDQVKLKLDKAAYRPGDKIKLNVEAPAAGKGYLMVESSEGPLWWQEISVPVGGADFEVPINKGWDRHDLYVSALVIRPGDKNLHATPKRAIGLLHIPLADPTRKIDVKLEAPAKIEPKQTLTVKVKALIKDAKPGKPVHVLVSAVDTGVLNITNFKTPDPYDSFFGRKRYSIDQFDVYGMLIEGKGRLASLRYGGDGEDDEGSLSRGGKKPITNVLIVALQAAPVTLNENGEAEVELDIPDFNGELRLMVQAWSDSDFGHSESVVTVAAPLVVELGAPRFMAGGDESRLALDLNNLSGTSQTLKVNIAATGLLQLAAPVSKDLTLENGKKTTLYIPLKAANGFGQGDVAVTISGLKLENQEDRTFQRTWTLGVRPAFPAATYNYSEVLRNGQSFILPENLMQTLDPSTMEAELLLSSRPPLNLALHISQLYAYPYGCAEQTTSGLFPSLYTNSAQLTALGIKTGSDEARRDSINLGIERLLGMQRFNGSFGLWSNESQEEFWVSAYITDFLLRARAQGYGVPEAKLDKAMARLQYYLQDRNQIEVNGSQNANHTRFAVQAYAGLVLARQQKAPLGALRQVFERRGDARSGLPLVQLAIALKTMGDEPRAKVALAEGLAKQRESSSYWWLSDYGSDVRDNALILSLLIENNLAEEDQDTRLLALSDSLITKRYLSTQERNAIFMAGRNSIGKPESKWTVELQKLSSDQPTILSDSKARSFAFNSAQLEDLVSMTNNGNATVYPRMNLSGYPLVAPAAESNKLNITRTVYGLDGRQVKLGSLKTGDLVVVHLNVSTTMDRIPDALVVDLLPAGLELENQNLGNSSASLSNSATNLKTLMNSMQQTTILHQEFRDDRYVAAVNVTKYRPATLLYLARAVTPGNYQVPAPYVESMYQPEWRAIGKTPERMVIR